MGKQKKATLHDASGKKILHPAEAERKKFKQRARENRAKNRKKNYETKMLQKAPELIEAEINDFQEMDKKGKLTKWKKDKMTREIAFYGRLKNQVESNNSKRMEDQAGDQFFVDFEELKIHRKASIYYDPVKNPYGAPPSGQVLMYRHPDGSVKREPPELPSGVSSAQLTQGLVPGHGDMVLPHQRPMQEEEDDGESEESEDDDDDEEDDEPMLPSELPDGTPLPASSAPGPPEPPGPPGPPEPPGLPPLPPGPPPLTSLPPMPPGPPPGCGSMGVGRGPPMMPKLPCFGGGAPQSQADFAKQMMSIGFMPPVPPPVVPEVMGVSGPVPKRPEDAGFPQRPERPPPPPKKAIFAGDVPPKHPPAQKAQEMPLNAKPPPPPPKKAAGPPKAAAATRFMPTTLRTKKPSQVAGGVLQASSASLSQENRKKLLLREAPKVAEKMDIEGAFQDFMHQLDD